MPHKESRGKLLAAELGHFHGPYGNFVLCTEKVSDKSDPNGHMQPVNGPEEPTQQSDPQHMDYRPTETRCHLAGSPGDFIRFVNELLY